MLQGDIGFEAVLRDRHELGILKWLNDEQFYKVKLEEF